MHVSEIDGCVEYCLDFVFMEPPLSTNDHIVIHPLPNKAKMGN